MMYTVLHNAIERVLRHWMIFVHEHYEIIFEFLTRISA
jgi:hypothetical protein